MKIEKGPFSGTEIPDNELSAITNNDGSTTEWWPATSRTPVFLSTFPPTEGWSIEVRREPGPFNLPDYRNAVAGNVTVQPTQLFVAVLLRNGVIVNQASSLEIIDGSKAWERGETNARGRLYEAMGLPGSTKPFLHQLLGDRKETARPVATSAGVSIIPISPAKAAPATEPAVPAAPAATANEVPANASEPASNPTQIETAVATSTTSSADPGHAPPSASIDVTSTTHKPAPQPDCINANLLNQIAVQAKIKGIVVPHFADNGEAKAFLKDLLTSKVA